MRHGLRVLTTVLIGLLAALPLGSPVAAVSEPVAADAEPRAGDPVDAAGVNLESPIVAFAPTPTGNGYWLAASDGGIFTYGDANFHGSAGNLPLQQPIVAFAPTPTGNGYWLAASDGGIFTYGDAHFHGSAAGRSSAPVAGMGSAHDGLGYRLATSSGKVFAFDAVEPPRPVGRRIPTGARPLDVMITGDSLAVSLQDGLDTGLRATGRARAIRRGRWCYGLSASWAPSPRNPFCPAIPIYAPHMLSDDITEFDPDAVVLMLGAWDWQGRRVGSRVLTPPSGAWWTWYEGLADDAFRRLSRRRAVTYWVGYPACGDGANVELERVLNGAARRAAWRNPTRAVYLDLHAEVCPNGPIRPLDPLPDGRRVVLLDETGHFSETGAEYTGRWIAEELGASFRLPSPR